MRSKIKIIFIVLTMMSVAFMANAQSCPDDNHPHAIDLGLPSGTKWACCNVGADIPEAYGGYYAWGETEEKDIYDWSTYIFSDGSMDTCHDIGSDIAGTEYDVAHIQWGASWVMPSQEQINELVNNCTYTWTSINDVWGGIFTGPSGGTIFLPGAGYRWLDDLYHAGSGGYLKGYYCSGYYWSSTQHPASLGNSSFSLYMDSGYSTSNGFNRYYGYTVRPVIDGTTNINLPDYYPHGTVWEEESHCYYPTTDTFNSTYLRNTVVGDTLISDIPYRRVIAEKRVGDNSTDYSWDRVSPWHWEPYDSYGIRQEGNKVYYFRYEPVIGEKEFMRYDFDWSAGMEIPLKLDALHNKDYTLAKIDRMENVVLGDGLSYESVTVEDGKEDVAQVKGIGSIGNYGGLFSYYAWNTVPWDGSTMYYHRVLNFTRDGICLYEWDRDSFVASQMELLGVNAMHDLASHDNGRIYTLDGRNVTGIPLHSLQKGIYIRNGRKFVVR